MGVFSTGKKTFKLIFNVEVDQWLDYEYLASSTRYMIRQLKDIYKVPTSPRTNLNFEETAEKLGWTTEYLQVQVRRFMLFSQCFLGFSLCCATYCILIGLRGNIMGAIMAFALMILSLVQAFRFHFWRYQLLRRQLGCTVQEWFHDLFHGLRKTPA